MRLTAIPGGGTITVSWSAAPPHVMLSPADRDPFVTETQREVLLFIASHVDVEGFPPTYREISDQFQWKSTWSAQKVVRALIRDGYVEQAEGKRRGLRVLELPR